MKKVFPRVLIGSFEEDENLSFKGCVFSPAVENPKWRFHCVYRQAAFLQELGGGKNDPGSDL
jgi:hypothetical protein